MKKLLLTTAIVALLAAGTACSGKRPHYNTRNEIPADAEVFELCRVGYDLWGGSHYVEVVAGGLEDSGFAPLSGKLTFKLDGANFEASFWDAHVEEQPFKPTFTSGRSFYENYYRETLKYVPEFYPVTCYYGFGQDDRLIYLEDVRDEIYNPYGDEP